LGSDFLMERGIVRQRHFYCVMSSIGFRLDIFVIVVGIRVDVRGDVGEKVMQDGVAIRINDQIGDVSRDSGKDYGNERIFVFGA